MLGEMVDEGEADGCEDGDRVSEMDGVGDIVAVAVTDGDTLAEADGSSAVITSGSAGFADGVGDTESCVAA